MREIKKTFTGIKQLPLWILHFLMGGNLVISISEELDSYLKSHQRIEGLILTINHSSYVDLPTVKIASMFLGLHPKFMAKASL